MKTVETPVFSSLLKKKSYKYYPCQLLKALRNWEMISFQTHPFGIPNCISCHLRAASGAVSCWYHPNYTQRASYHTWRLRASTHCKTFSLGGFPKLQRRAGKGFLRDETNKVTATNERDISALTEDSQRDLISDSAKNNVPLDCK